MAVFRSPREGDEWSPSSNHNLSTVHALTIKSQSPSFPTRTHLGYMNTITTVYFTHSLHMPYYDSYYDVYFSS